MRVGLSTRTVYDENHNLKKLDGIGTYTYNLEQNLRENNVNIEEVSLRTRNEVLRQFLPFSFHSKVEQKIDLFHATDYLTPRMSVPVVSTIHDAIMLKYPEWDTGNKLSSLRNFLLKRFAKNADHIITDSYAMVGDIVEYWGLKEEQISVVYPGISADWFARIPKEETKNILAKYSIEKPYFLVVGTLQERKNIVRIIDACLKLPKAISDNFLLIIVGKESKNLTKPELIETINEQQEKGRVRWLRHVPFQDLRALYQDASILLFPSLAEGFGFPILEGFASQTPVITSDFGSTKEIGGDAACLVDSYAVENISSAIEKLLNDRGICKSIIDQGLLRAREFTWDRCAKETIKVYNSLV